MRTWSCGAPILPSPYGKSHAEKLMEHRPWSRGGLWGAGRGGRRCSAAALWALWGPRSLNTHVLGWGPGAAAQVAGGGVGTHL